MASNRALTTGDNSKLRIKQLVYCQWSWKEIHELLTSPGGALWMNASRASISAERSEVAMVGDNVGSENKSVAEIPRDGREESSFPDRRLLGQRAEMESRRRRRRKWDVEVEGGRADGAWKVVCQYGYVNGIANEMVMELPLSESRPDDDLAAADWPDPKLDVCTVCIFVDPQLRNRRNRRPKSEFKTSVGAGYLSQIRDHFPLDSILSLPPPRRASFPLVDIPTRPTIPLNWTIPIRPDNDTRDLDKF